MPFPGQTIGEVVVVSADPAAGAEISYTADQDMIVHAVGFNLVTSATVANRFPGLVADDGGSNVFFETQTGSAETASATWRNYAFEGAPSSSGNPRTFPLPAGGLRLKKGDRIRTLTGAIDAGDNYGSMILQIEHL